MGKWQGVSKCPPCDVLEELLRKHRASAGGKGGIFEEFQPKKPRVISADLDLSLRVVCR